MYLTHTSMARRCGIYFQIASEDSRRHGTYHKGYYFLYHVKHKFLIEPLSKRQHIIFSLRKRFLKFVKCATESQKSVLRNVLNSIKRDCRSVTGRNLRKIMISTEKNFKATCDPPYCEIPPGES